MANAVAVQPDGKIVVAGFATEPSGINSDFALARYNPDGTPDDTFDGDGIVTTDLSGQDDDARALAIQPDGKIVVVGSAGDKIGLVRYTAEGSLDPTFGGGVKISDLGTNIADGVAVTPEGTILIGATRSGPDGLDPIVASFDPNGELNLGFGHGGIAQADLSGRDDFGNNLVLDAHGNIVVVGTSGAPCSSPACGTTPPTPTGPDMALVRFKPDGTPDTSFGTNGILTADFHGRNDDGEDVAVDPQGRIVAVGTSGHDEFALMRANP